MAKTVLIVEDNELNMKLFRDLLEAHGYQTVGTRTGLKHSISPARIGPISSSWIFSYPKFPVST